MASYQLDNINACKTGSTDVDNLAVAYNPQVLVASWVGYDDNRKMETADDKTVAKKTVIDVLNYTNEKKGYDPRYYVVSDDQSQVPYRYYGNTEELSEIEILIDEELRFLPEVSEIVGAIVNSKKNKNDHKIFYPEV